MISLLVSFSQLLVKIIDKLSVDQRINVLPELVKDEPVSELALGEDVVQGPWHLIVILPLDLPVEEAVPHTVEHQGDEAIAEINNRYGAWRKNN